MHVEEWPYMRGYLFLYFVVLLMGDVAYSFLAAVQLFCNKFLSSLWANSEKLTIKGKCDLHIFKTIPYAIKLAILNDYLEQCKKWNC